ncbi:hypothetical protein AGDE_15440 [Angomonas deanei]|uniref:Uncharacterized protein n=1 Tax=Angomonas deanei TaxID=59799 RepID=A0A7G2CUR6_9TRYP|nr:hypothetical protein AGDE_15440 [Angomonas deanei]CAD2222987.1 hypothetical protein, conserved [Angomonas deanei]|eukprot:EPY19071.1 hypothetical protein AGDE_15440 [Angomonas deanei]
MDFSDIPESLVDTIKALPGFRATPKEVHKREEAALQAYRNLMNITVKRRSTSRNAVMALTSPVPAEECAPSSVGGTSTTREEESSSLSEKKRQ